MDVVAILFLILAREFWSMKFVENHGHKSAVAEMLGTPSGGQLLLQYRGVYLFSFTDKFG